MPSVSSMNLIEELRQSGDDFENAVLASYSFDPQFFEEKLLPILQAKDPDNIIVLTDSDAYAKTFGKARSAGMRYLIDGVTVGNAFHPKLVLLTSASAENYLSGVLT